MDKSSNIKTEVQIGSLEFYLLSSQTRYSDTSPYEESECALPYPNKSFNWILYRINKLTSLEKPNL